MGGKLLTKSMSNSFGEYYICIELWNLQNRNVGRIDGRVTMFNRGLPCGKWGEIAYFVYLWEYARISGNGGERQWVLYIDCREVHKWELW